MEGMRTPVARDGRRAIELERKVRRAAGRALFVVCMVTLFCVGGRAAAIDDERDFPPLSGPGRPAPVVPTPTTTPTSAPPSSTPTTPVSVPSNEPYRLGVGDEVSVSVLAEPDLSGVVKVRPDGALTTPGAGTIHALGRTPEEVGQEIEEKLGQFLRHPHVDLVVTNFGEQRIFVMGEVLLPGDKPFYKGISALQAVAQCGGFNDRGSKASVLVLRRTGANDVEVRKLDLKTPLKGDGAGSDVALRPYDIVYVPKTSIANVDTFFDQYFKQTLSAFTIYIEGWKAVKLSTDNVRWVTGP
jgi:protein involved in polysaccharide export with SLBB domain